MKDFEVNGRLPVYTLFITLFIIGALSSTWWNTTWNYKQQINITGWNCDWAYCQFPINFSSSKANGTDVRVLNATEDGPLPFFLESGNWSNATGIGNIWVNASNNTASVWIYYNASGVAYIGNGDAVFSFFDDFNNGTSYTAGNWTGNTTVGTIAGGIMNYSAASAAWVGIRSTTAFTVGASIVGRVFFANGNYNIFGAGSLVAPSDANSTDLRGYAYPANPCYAYVNGNISNRKNLGNCTEKWLGVRITSNTNDATFYQDYQTPNGTITQTTTSRNMMLSSSKTTTTGSLLVDWCGIAQMPTANPTLLFGTETASNSTNNLTNLTVGITPNPIITTGSASCNIILISSETNQTVQYEWYKNFYLLTSGDNNVFTGSSVTVSTIANSSYSYDDIMLCQVRAWNGVGWGSWVASNATVVKTSPQPLITYSIPALIVIFWNQWSWLFMGIFCLGVSYIMFQPYLHTTMLSAGILSFAAFCLTAYAGQTEMAFIYTAIVYFTVGMVLRFSGSK
jgi:hypothetical protein